MNVLAAAAAAEKQKQTKTRTQRKKTKNNFFQQLTVAVLCWLQYVARREAKQKHADGGHAAPTSLASTVLAGKIWRRTSEMAWVRTE